MTDLDNLEYLRKIASSYAGASPGTYLVTIAWGIPRMDPPGAENKYYRGLLLDKVTKAIGALDWPYKPHEVANDGSALVVVVTSNLAKRSTEERLQLAMGNVTVVRRSVVIVAQS